MKVMMLTRTALATAALLFASTASAALSITPCADTPGAIANDTDPLACALGTLANDSIASETQAANDTFGGGLSFIGKFDKEGGPESVEPGWGITVEDGADGWDYAFQLSSATLVGQMIDLVLMIKQPGGPESADYAAYYWEGLVLDIDGFFNSFRGDYSHVSLFYRGPDHDLAEPGMLMLLGAGLIAFVLVRRRIA